eukprot:6834466-Lingulodinium_polyedra.AAC.1
MLSAGTDTGLGGFVSPNTPQPLPAAGVPGVPKTLVLCVDQGSSGWCPSLYLLLGKHLRLMLLHDPSHRVWNDVKGAIGLS